ncbi:MULTISPECIES: isocitrate lyase/phosphoenolpyruvate mutase family protein [Brenneria]|uniref:isocitrate lyase/phosphoenolpyruvate mutase family protein n=1 Tax=Brenneria TaxID=71655 RepID=UPI0002D99DE8|nr:MULTISPECIES: isocitrate lyase/phosphoenolpyruvate mutase family protein [Brenneria]
MDTIRTLCQSLTKPVNVIAGIQGTTFSVDQLAHAGVKRISVGSALSRLALGSFIRAVEEMNNSGSFLSLDDAIGFADIEGYFTSASR